MQAGTPMTAPDDATRRSSGAGSLPVASRPDPTRATKISEGAAPPSIAEGAQKSPRPPSIFQRRLKKGWNGRVTVAKPEGGLARSAV